MPLNHRILIFGEELPGALSQTAIRFLAPAGPAEGSVALVIDHVAGQTNAREDNSSVVGSGCVLLELPIRLVIISDRQTD